MGGKGIEVPWLDILVDAVAFGVGVLVSLIGVHGV